MSTTVHTLRHFGFHSKQACPSFFVPSQFLVYPRPPPGTFTYTTFLMSQCSVGIRQHAHACFALRTTTGAPRNTSVSHTLTQTEGGQLPSPAKNAVVHKKLRISTLTFNRLLCLSFGDGFTLDRNKTIPYNIHARARHHLYRVSLHRGPERTPLLVKLAIFTPGSCASKHQVCACSRGRIVEIWHEQTATPLHNHHERSMHNKQHGLAVSKTPTPPPPPARVYKTHNKKSRHTCM